MRLALGYTCLAFACSRPNADQKPVPVATAAPILVASAPSADPLMTVASLMFVKGQLRQCDQITNNTSKLVPGMQKIRDAMAADTRKEVKEVLLENKSCAEGTSNRPHQATCSKAKIVTYYYNADELKGSDAIFQKCVSDGGTWKTNDAPEAELDALERKVNSPEHQALRKRVLDMASE